MKNYEEQEEREGEEVEREEHDEDEKKPTRSCESGWLSPLSSRLIFPPTVYSRCTHKS